MQIKALMKFHIILSRLAKKKKNLKVDDKYWKGFEITGAFIHCW